ncbi:MAG: DUF3107 domain-containing protein [Acidimicrobiales bacterium]
MDVRIGLTDTSRELELELPDDADEAVLAGQVNTALVDGHGVLSLTDRRGRRILVAVAKIAWVEIGTGSDRHVGFGG